MTHKEAAKELRKLRAKNIPGFREALTIAITQLERDHIKKPVTLKKPCKGKPVPKIKKR